MATLADIIELNGWTSASIEQSTEVNRLFSSGMLTKASPEAQAMINAVNPDNVQSEVLVGIVGADWAEQNFGDATSTEAGAIAPFFKEARAKTFYGNQWWEVYTIWKDLLQAAHPNAYIQQKIGEYWATTINKIQSATLSGMSDIAEITIGDATGNFSRSLVIQARKLKGDMGAGKLANLYMSSTTLFDILEKIEATTIAQGTIVEAYGTSTIVVDGVTTIVQADTPTYRYNGVTEIIVDDAMTDGIISLVEQGAFAYAANDKTTALTYSNDPKAGNGAGKEEFGTKLLYMVHPIGFDFVGVEGTDYTARGGLTIAELQGGGLYEAVAPAKLLPITNILVKIGA